MFGNEVAFDSLKGRTLTAIEPLDMCRAMEEITFVCADGARFRMQHVQDCCENVWVEEVVGNVSDLIGSPIIEAECVESSDDPDGFKHEYQPESQTWTFYKLGTAKGFVTIRWLGTSNGHYSERVDFIRVPD